MTTVMKQPSYSRIIPGVVRESMRKKGYLNGAEAAERAGIDRGLLKYLRTTSKLPALQEGGNYWHAIADLDHYREQREVEESVHVTQPGKPVGVSGFFGPLVEVTEQSEPLLSPELAAQIDAELTQETQREIVAVRETPFVSYEVDWVQVQSLGLAALRERTSSPLRSIVTEDVPVLPVVIPEARYRVAGTTRSGEELVVFLEQKNGHLTLEESMSDTAQVRLLEQELAGVREEMERLAVRVRTQTTGYKRVRDSLDGWRDAAYRIPIWKEPRPDEGWLVYSDSSIPGTVSFPGVGYGGSEEEAEASFRFSLHVLFCDLQKHENLTYAQQNQYDFLQILFEG